MASLPLTECSRNYIVISALVSPPRKLRAKKSQSCSKFVAEVVPKIWKSCIKVVHNLHIFGCKMLLWHFGTLANFANEQQNHIHQYYRPN